jgi:hypothetical protein
MSLDGHNTSSQSVEEAERTLRLIARLPAPEGVEDRVKGRLKAAPRSSRVLAWPGADFAGRKWSQMPMVRGAAAAVIVCLIGGGAWQVYSRVQTPSPSTARVIPISPRQAAPGSFSNAGAMRSPQTLHGPVLAHPARPPVKPVVKEHSKGAPSTSSMHAKKKSAQAPLNTQP